MDGSERERMEIWLALLDEEYMRLFSNYIANSNDNRQKFRCRLFTKANLLTEQLGRVDRYHCILFLDEEMQQQLQSIDDDNDDLGLPHVILNVTGEEMQVEDKLYMNKYQSIDVILQKAIQFHQHRLLAWNHSEGAREGEHSRASIISIGSASGGLGKSLFSLQLACFLEQLGKRVLLVNMEALSAVFSEQVKEKQPGLDQVIYDVRAHPKRLNETLKKTVYSGTEWPFDVLLPFQSIRSLKELTKEDMNGLISGLRSLEYDVVLLDLESGWNEPFEAARLCSDLHIWFLLAEYASARKMKGLLQQLQEWEEGSGKIAPEIFILNKAQQASIDADLRLDPLKEHYTLPYVPEWKWVRSWSNLVPPQEYQRGISRIVQSHFDVNNRRDAQHAGDHRLY